MIDFNVPLDGLNRAASTLDQSARRIASIGGSPEGDSVDLSAEAVAMIEAKITYQANASLLRTGGELAKALIDVLG
jgi:flagellar hook protein FlgE